MWKALLQRDPVSARALKKHCLRGFFLLGFFFPLDKLRENTKRAYKTKVQDSLDLLPEQVIFKKQQKLDD